MKRREFLGAAATAGLSPLFFHNRLSAAQREAPNLLFVFADQWRAQSAGLEGREPVRTPRIDAFAGESIRFRNAVASCPVCTPWRGTLMTGQYPDQHGLFLNDVHLSDELPSLGKCLQARGHHTGWIGKWHINGRGRSAYIPPEERQGFEFWRTLECTHDYNNSYYYGDTEEKLKWEGYDAIAQTREAVRFLEERNDPRPFALFLSWGPPHNPFHTAPEHYRAMYQEEEIPLPPNVPEEHAAEARHDLSGYYAHCTALDDCLGELLASLKRLGLEENTIVVFTSDHGEMLYSQGEQRKQRPWDESILVPFLIRYPERFGRTAREIHAPLGTPDLMPTLLDLCGAEIPEAVQGQSLVPWLDGAAPEDRAALIACYSPFGEWTRARGGREYRGIRTRRYTYVRTLDAPWLLYDNAADPYQRENLCGREGQHELQARLDAQLQRELRAANDAFLPGEEYIRRWGYEVDESGTVRYGP